MMISLPARHTAYTPRMLEQVAQCIRGGGVVVYPTDSTYAFGCDMHNKAAVERILAIKQMPRNKLLALVCSDLKEISQYAYVSNAAYKVIKRLLPGAYTLVFQATKLVPKITLTRQATVGVRIPEHPFCAALAATLGQPILSTSARLADGPLFSEPLEIEETLGGAVDMVIDGGILLPQPSTILDMREEPPKVIREGKGDVSWLES